MKNVGEKFGRIILAVMFIGLFLVASVPSVSADLFITNVTKNTNVYNTSIWTFEVDVGNESFDNINGSVIYKLWNTSPYKALDDGSTFDVATNYTTTNTTTIYTRTFTPNLTSFWPGQSFLLEVIANYSDSRSNSTNFTITVNAANTSELEPWLLANMDQANNISGIDFRFSNDTDESSGLDIVNTTSDNYLMILTTNVSSNLLVTVGNFSEIDLNRFDSWNLSTVGLNLGGIPTYQINYYGLLNLNGFIPSDNYTWGRINTTGTWQKHYWLTGANLGVISFAEITSECDGEDSIESTSQVLASNGQCVITNGDGDQILYSGSFGGWLVQKSTPSGNGAPSGGGSAPRRSTVTTPSRVAPQDAISLPSAQSISDRVSGVGTSIRNFFQSILDFFRS